MNPKKTIVLLTLAALSMIAVSIVTTNAIPSDHPHFGPLGTIYVNGQGLYYDTFVTVEPIPYTGHNGGSFQQIYPDHSTDYGPGDPGYRGGRWWVDLNNNHVMDPEGIDHYLLCPLIGPGRATP